MAKDITPLRLSYKTGDNATCRCGCGEKVGKKSKFRQGHDARMKGRVADAINNGAKIETNVDGTKTLLTPKAYAKANFSEAGQAGITKLAETRKAAAAARAAKQKAGAAKAAETTRAAVAQHRADKAAETEAQAAAETGEPVVEVPAEQEPAAV